MSKVTFFILFFSLLLMIWFKDKILQIFHKNSILKHISDLFLTSSLILLISALTIFGILFMEDTKMKFQDISNSMKKIRSPSTAERPHRYFDINTYD